MKSLVRFSMLALACGFICDSSSGCTEPTPQVKRYGSVIGIKKESIPEYKRLHADCWPGVLKMIEECHIRNYSIYLAEVEPDEFYLFSYFEYTGDDFEADMAAMAADEETLRWWDECKPCLDPVEDLPPGEVWAPMQSVFFHP